MKAPEIWIEGENRSDLKTAVIYIIFSIGFFLGFGIAYFLGRL